MANRELEEFYQTLLGHIPQGELTLAKLRQGLEKLLSLFPAAPDVKFHPVSIGKLSAAWIQAPGCTQDRVILFFHGGAYSAGSFESHQDMLGRLAKASKSYILAVDYRLAPEHPFPAAVEDAVISYQFLLKEFKPEQIFVAGSSAGGGLAIALLLKLIQMKKPLPKAGICLSPWVDLALTGKTLTTNDGKDLIQKERLQMAVDIYLKGHDPKDPLASPLYANLKGLPPLLIQVGSRELLLDEIERFAQKAKESGVDVQLEVYPDMIHTWQLFASKIPDGEAAIQKVGKYIRSM
jgi:epsilon-lactone hydrolase